MTFARPPATRRSILAGWALGLAVAAGLVQAAAAADGKAPPLGVFFGDNDIDAVGLSPSGRWVALTTAARAGRHTLAVVDLTGEAKPLIVASFGDADVTQARWVSDERLIFSAIDFHRGEGKQPFSPGLFVVKRDGSELATLITGGGPAFTTGTLSHGHEPLSADHALLFVPPGGGDEIIVGGWEFDQQGDVQAVDAMRLNVVTRRTTSLSLGRPDHAKSWLFDPQGEPRVVEAWHAGRTQVWWRAPGQSGWAALAEFPTLHATFEPLFVDGAGQLYVSDASGEGGTDVIRRFDVAKGKPAAEPMVSTPGFDADDPLLTDDTGAKVLGVRVDTDAEASLWFDPRMKALQALVDAKLPGRVNEITCRQCMTTGALLVLSRSDQEPGEWWAYRPADKTWQSIGRARRDVVAREMAPLDFHRTRARDGEDLPVWVTTPRLPKGAPPPPAVVLVHGGPFVRGTHWRWDREAQFLASRGYAVIQPEFRGSAGYGAAHERAGWKQWGGAMQDDVADAVNWAVSQKMIDPKRVCIAGASYGGYAALMGAVRHPELYRCVVAWAAVTDPRFLYEENWTSDVSAEVRGYDLPDKLGDLSRDAARLADASAVGHAARIKVPVLLAFGGADRRVPIKHGTEMRAALRAAGNDPEWIVYPDETHGWLTVETNLDFWSRVEAFLAKNDR